MPNQKISELTAIVTVDNSVDVLPIVDISANTTKKVTPNALKTALALDNVNNTSDANKPVSIAQQDALNAKVDENAPIVAATKTKITYDAKGLVTAGDILDAADMPTGINAANIGTGVVSSTEFGYLDGVTSAIQTQLNAKQATLVSGTNIKTVNSTSLLGSGDVAVQPTLVSGTNIKTINSTSLLGSGDITISANPSGIAGAIQFSNGSAFASDAANLFWDDTNNRLGVGLNTPATTLDILPPVQTATATQFDCMRVGYSNSTIGITNGSALQVQVATTGSGRYSTTLRLSGSSDTSQAYLKGFASNNFGVMLNRANSNLGLFSDNGIKLGDTAFAGSEGVASGMVHIKGSGSTSATTSLLVQNSAGTNIFKIGDSARIDVLGTIGQIDFSSYYQIFSTGNQSTVGCYKGSQAFSVDGSRLCVNVSTGSHSASASFQVDSTTTGILPPRMTTTQKNAIASPAAGLVVYDSTTNKLQCYNGSTWNDLF